MPNPQPASLGRVVLFHFHDRRGNLVSRPATVVRVWNPNQVNLQVFTDGKADGEDQAGGLWYRPSVTYHETPLPGFWSWPPRV